MAEIVGLAASIIAVIDLAAKVGVLCSRYCADIQSARRDVRYILNEADRLSVTLRDVERLLKGPNGTKFDASLNIRRAVADCRQQLDTLVAKLEEGTKYRNIKWPLKKEEVADITKDLGRCQTSISLDLQVHQSYVSYVSSLRQEAHC